MQQRRCHPRSSDFGMERGRGASKPDRSASPTVAKSYSIAVVSAGASITAIGGAEALGRKRPRTRTRSAPGRRALPAAARRPPVDDGIADQQRRWRDRRRRGAEVLQAGGIGLSRQRAVAADNRVRLEEPREIESRRESYRVAASGLLVSTASGVRALERLEHLVDIARIRPRVTSAGARCRSPESASSASGGGATPPAANARATSVAAPSPTMRPIASSGSGAQPHAASSALADSARSRRESTSVPSRSKTMSDHESRTEDLRIEDLRVMRLSPQILSPQISASIQRTTSAFPTP